MRTCLVLVLLLAGCAPDPQTLVAEPCYAGQAEGDHGDRDMCREWTGSDMAWCRRLNGDSSEGVCAVWCNTNADCYGGTTCTHITCYSSGSYLPFEGCSFCALP